MTVMMRKIIIGFYSNYVSTIKAFRHDTFHKKGTPSCSADYFREIYFFIMLVVVNRSFPQLVVADNACGYQFSCRP